MNLIIQLQYSLEDTEEIIAHGESWYNKTVFWYNDVNKLVLHGIVTNYDTVGNLEITVLKDGFNHKPNIWVYEKRVCKTKAGALFKRPQYFYL